MTVIKANQVKISLTESTYEGEREITYSPVWEILGGEGEVLGYLVEYDNTYDAFYKHIHDFVDEIPKDDYTATKTGDQEWTERQFAAIINDHIECYGDDIPKEITDLVPSYY